MKVSDGATTSFGTEDGALRDAAFAALEQAYAPYSNFRVGAALRATDGTIITGCNVENASYGGALCAEQNAIAAAIARGLRDFTELMVVTESDAPTPPCGFCRQILVEFAPTLNVTSITRSGRSARWTLAELLPHPFTSSSLTSA